MSDFNVRRAFVRITRLTQRAAYTIEVSELGVRKIRCVDFLDPEDMCGFSPPRPGPSRSR
eukprot:5177498-Prymnesium_polylepis.1